MSHTTITRCTRVVLVLLALVISPAALAEPSSAEAGSATDDQPEPATAPGEETSDASDAAQLGPEAQQAQATWAAARHALKRGPMQVALRDQAMLEVPEGFGFVPTQEAMAVMQLMGNTADERFIGLVFPLTDGDSYFVSLEYEESGYIKDDEAQDWDADALLQSLKDGTEASNEERAKRGIPAIKVTRWIEPPAYDATTHRLLWSAEAMLKEGADADPTINYNTYFLGREGYISADLVSTASSIDADKTKTATLLEGVTFNESKRYADFDSSTDKVAAYGLTALIGGIAAKKLGLIAVVTGLVAKFAKLLVAGAVIAFAGVRKMMGRKPDQAA